MGKWTVENFKGETLKFEGDEVKTGTMFQFFNVENCTIEIVGKCKQVCVMNCKKLKMHMDTVILGIEASGCNAIEFHSRGTSKLPAVTAQKCN